MMDIRSSRDTTYCSSTYFVLRLKWDAFHVFQQPNKKRKKKKKKEKETRILCQSEQWRGAMTLKTKAG